MPDMATSEELRRILRLIESDSEIRAEVRRAVLTDELLDLPRRVSELDARLTARMDQLTERMDQLTERMDQLTERMDQLTERMGQLQIEVASLVEIARRHDAKLGMLSGWRYEALWQDNASAYLGSRGFGRVRRLSKEALADLLDDAEELGTLTPAERDDALLIDAAHRALRREDRAQVVVATEVSVRVHADDVERARRRAALLEAALALNAVACVAGASIDDTARSLAESTGVVMVLPADWRVSEAA